MVTDVSREVDDEYRLHRRFDRIGRLVGDHGMDQLRRAFVIVFGLGGVGSFAAESLARSGVGRLRIVDFDKVCVTNVNRQLHAVCGAFGKAKAALMGDRLRAINPRAEVEALEDFYQADDAERLLSGAPDFVVDAIDQITGKCHLIANCVKRGIPLVSSMGSGGRLDPTRVRVVDLNHTNHCALAADVRKILRENYAFSRDKKGSWGVAAVYSDEPVIRPYGLAYEDGGAFRCVCPHGDNGLLTCGKRARIDGTVSFVTGTFGLVAASVAVRGLVGASLTAGDTLLADPR
jgi:tRNA A37 threonylcarbamoyladenosine dehydratase